jgi:hypothetical protein
VPGRFLIVAALLWLAGCSAYQLVPSGTREVSKGSFRVSTTVAWNRVQPVRRAPLVEQWTLNGSMLDSVSFVGGMPDGAVIVESSSQLDARENPRFRITHEPSEMLMLVARYYRESLAAKDFELLNEDATQFLGQQASTIDFTFMGEDEALRRGHAVWAIINEHRYMMLLAGTDQHYFDAALPEFNAMVASASMGRRRL